MVALDDRAHTFFKKHGVPVAYDPLAAVSGSGVDAQYHRSGGFMDIMHARIFHLVRILRAGYDVLFTDVDAVFRWNPFTVFRDENHVEFAYDTPFLPGSHNSPLMVWVAVLVSFSGLQAEMVQLGYGWLVRFEGYGPARLNGE